MMKVEDDDVKGEEDNDVANDDVEDDDVEDNDIEEADRSQDLGPHFVRACAFKIHLDM